MANPGVGQVLLMSKEVLTRRVLANQDIDIYDCGRDDIRSGQVDRRVLATLEFLAASGLRPTVTSLKCGHGFLTKSGNVSHHSSGNAVDISAINGTPILGHQGKGEITEATVRKLHDAPGRDAARADHLAAGDRRPTRSRWATMPTTSTSAGGRCSAPTSGSAARRAGCCPATSGTASSTA